MRYTYETLPGQTVVRTTARDGFDWAELLAELKHNGDGIVVTDAERCDDRIRSIEGQRCSEMTY